jgi:hypothetical protein
MELYWGKLLAKSLVDQ